VFSKSTTSITGPDDVIIIPRGSEKTDWEVELAVVIGRTARYVAVHDALAHVAGYLICNDVSERAYQLERGGTWDKGKGCDSFAPLGPWLGDGRRDRRSASPSRCGSTSMASGCRTAIPAR